MVSTRIRHWIPESFVKMVTIDRIASSNFKLSSELRIPHPIEAVFEFFSDAFNLEKITPPWLHFQVLTPPPIQMAPGTLIDYRLRVRGFPIRWQSAITAWEPPFRFVDEQRRGPYRIWHHEHIFEQLPTGTLVKDEVIYKPLGGSLVNRFFVAPDLRKIFSYRVDVLKSIFGDGLPE